MNRPALTPLLLLTICVGVLSSCAQAPIPSAAYGNYMPKHELNNEYYAMIVLQLQSDGTYQRDLINACIMETNEGNPGRFEIKGNQIHFTGGDMDGQTRRIRRIGQKHFIFAEDDALPGLHARFGTANVRQSPYVQYHIPEE